MRWRTLLFAAAAAVAVSFGVGVALSPAAPSPAAAFQCAPEVAREMRHVVLVDFHDGAGNGSAGGETFVARSLQKALASLGFTTAWINVHQMQRLDFSRTHLVVGNGEWFLRTDGRGGGPTLRPVVQRKLDICRVRALYFWGRTVEVGVFDGVRASTRQYLLPYREPCAVNTFVGFHAPRPPPGLRPERGKVGIVWGKRGKYITPRKRVLAALVAAGYEVHVTCTAKGTLRGPGGGLIPEVCDLPDGVINHQLLPPDEWRALVSRSSFMLGLGDPLLGPSAVEALTLGATVLLPDFHSKWVKKFPDGTFSLPCSVQPRALRARPSSVPPQATQHDGIASLGAPYVLHVDLEDVEDVLAAVNYTVNHRFATYVPPDYRWDSMLRRACGIVEDASLCGAGALRTAPESPSPPPPAAPRPKHPLQRPLVQRVKSAKPQHDMAVVLPAGVWERKKRPLPLRKEPGRA